MGSFISVLRWAGSWLGIGFLAPSLTHQQSQFSEINIVVNAYKRKIFNEPDNTNPTTSNRWAYDYVVYDHVRNPEISSEL